MEIREGFNVQRLKNQEVSLKKRLKTKTGLVRQTRIVLPRASKLDSRLAFQL